MTKVVPVAITATEAEITEEIMVVETAEMDEGITEVEVTSEVEAILFLRS